MHPVRTLALAAALLLAGCLGATPEEPAPEPEPAGTDVIVGDRPDPTFGNVDTGEAAAADEAATLTEPPTLRPGEWWRIRTETGIEGGSQEFVRVMAEISDTGYVFGMPHEGWLKEAVIFHVPFFGDVGFDLSGHAHDVPMVLLKFPLVDGQTWTTQYMGPPDLTATVDADEAASTANVVFTDPDGNVVIDLTYDAKVHEIVRFESEFMSYEVLEHGYDYEGWVTVPRGHKTPILTARVGPLLDETGGAASQVTDTITVSGGFNRMSLLAGRGDVGFLGAVTGAPVPGGSPGVYGVRITDPAGTAYELEPTVMTDGFDIAFFESADVDGDWTIEYTATGAGAIFTMGIAYHQYDIKLPEGTKRSDHSHPVIR